MVTTSYFKISSGTYVRHCFWIWIEKWWWTLVIPLCILAILASGDMRYAIVAFALSLVVYPGIMAILYFNYALRPSAALALLSRRMSLDLDGILIEYEHSDEHPTPKPIHITPDQIDMATDNGSDIIISLKSSKYDFILIPSEAFAPGDHAKATALIIDNGVLNTTAYKNVNKLN